jgi:methyl-accepting chemotaxis protein
MASLTKTRLAEVNRVLDDSFFTSAGFTVNTEGEGERILQVKLVDYEKYFIELGLETKFRAIAMAQGEEPKKTLVVTQSPGDFVEEDRREVSDFGEFLGVLGNWTERLKGEILLVDLFQQKLKEFQADLNQRLDEHIKDGSAHFTSSEREQLNAKLREFEQRIGELEESKAATKAEVKEIRSTIEDLARAAHTMSKRAWFRTASTKLFAISVRAMTSKPGQELIQGTIKHLLEGRKSSP